MPLIVLFVGVSILLMKEKGYFQKEIKMTRYEAISALRPISREQVELEDGESCWVLVHTVDDIKALFVSAFDQYDYGNRELYGQTWLAYRRPPEGEEEN